MKRESSIGQKPHAANRQPRLSKSAKSLRQTGISLRLELGPNPDDRDLAKWARTSPAMIPASMTVGPCHAHVDGFDLHAGIVTRAGQRDRLERLCRGQ